MQKWQLGTRGQGGFTQCLDSPQAFKIMVSNWETFHWNTVITANNTEVLNLWIVTPLVSKQHFHKGLMSDIVHTW